MPQREQVYVFEFVGRTTGGEEGANTLHSEVLSGLNAKRVEIAEEIRSEMRSMLPPGVNVDAQIAFSRGSIEWARIVIVLDWMARLSGAVALIQLLKSAVEISVNRAVSENIGRAGWSIMYVETEVEVTTSTTTEVDVRRDRQSVDRWDWEGPAVLVLNTLLLVAILALTIWFGR